MVKSFKEWASEEYSHLFEMANILTEPGKKGTWTLGPVEAEGIGVVNVLKELGGKAKIAELASGIIENAKFRKTGEKGDFKTLEELAVELGQDFDVLKKAVIDEQKAQLRKQKAASGQSWKKRIEIVGTNADATWTLTGEAEAPVGGGKGQASDKKSLKDLFAKKEDAAE